MYIHIFCIHLEKNSILKVKFILNCRTVLMIKDQCPSMYSNIYHKHQTLNKSFLILPKGVSKSLLRKKLTMIFMALKIGYL